MLENFLMAGEQTLIVFLLIALGFFTGKKGIIDNHMADKIAGIVINIAMPAVIILAFQREFEKGLVKEFMLSMVMDVLGTVLAILVAVLTIRGKDSKRISVLRNAAIFPNIAMMAMPMQGAMFGADGVFCGAAHIAVFNLVFWPYCEIVLGNGDKKSLLKKIFLNPCVISTGIALLLFFSGITIPEIPAKALGHLSDLVLPLSMIILGQKLTRKPFATLFGDWGNLLAAAEKLVIVPLLLLFMMKGLHIGGVVGVSTVISVASPAAANVGMVAVTYGQDSELAASAVSMSTVLSLITMPLIIALASIMLL